MKKAIAIILSVLFILSLASCGQNNAPANGSSTEAEDVTQSAEPVSGGWAIYKDVPDFDLPEAVNDAFIKSVSKLDGVNYEPVAYIGSQVVAGMNYAVLCKTTPIVPDPETSLNVLIIYADLNGGAEVTGIADFNIADYTQGEGKSPEALAGGWSAPDDFTAWKMPEDADEAFKKAVEGYDGNKPDPMALLGSQVVAGTNYAVLCHSETAGEDPVGVIQVVTVYADLNGKAEISNVCTLDIADFNK